MKLQIDWGGILSLVVFGIVIFTGFHIIHENKEVWEQKIIPFLEEKGIIDTLHFADDIPYVTYNNKSYVVSVYDNGTPYLCEPKVCDPYENNSIFGSLMSIIALAACVIIVVVFWPC